jgi:hypothetical protein
MHYERASALTPRFDFHDERAQGALLPCAFIHIATKPTPGTSI